jgi:hypothetical protein
MNFEFRGKKGKREVVFVLHSITCYDEYGKVGV